MGCHHDAVQVGVFANPLEFSDATHIERVRTDDVDSVGFDQFHEVLAQVNLFAGMNGGAGFAFDVAVLGG